MQDAPVGNARAGINRVRAKLTTAAGVVEEVTKHVEDHCDKIINKRDDVMNHSDKAFAPHFAMLDDTAAGLEDLDDALKTMGNGGPLLSSNASGSQ